MEISRPQTTQEKSLKSGGFKDIKSWRESDFMQTNLAKSSHIAQDFIYTRREPYCFKCANTAIKEKIRDVEKQIAKSRTRQERNIKIDATMNFNVFGGFDKFEYVGEKEIHEKPLTATTQSVRIITGKYKIFMCKQCNSEIKIEFRHKELDELTNIKKREILHEKPLPEAPKNEL